MANGRESRVRVSNVVGNLRQLLPRPRPPAAWSRFRSTTEAYFSRARTELAPYWQRAVEWYRKRGGEIEMPLFEHLPPRFTLDPEFPDTARALEAITEFITRHA